jgi:hypothetical protein
MTDPNGTQPAAAAPPAAATPETPPTAEQLWDELNREDPAPSTPDEAAPAGEPAAAGDPDAPPGWNEADDDAIQPPTPSQPDATKDETADDPWAKAPPEVLKEREKMEHTIRSLTGRVRALTKRHMERPAAPSKDETDALAATKKVLAEKASEYPDILGPVVESIEKLETKITGLEKATDQERQAILDEEWGTFTSIHPDGMKVIEENGTAFASWLKAQPKDVQSIIEANKDAVIDGAAAAEVVSRFKDHVAAAKAPPAQQQTTPTPDPRRDLQLRGANATQSRPAPSRPTPRWRK